MSEEKNIPEEESKTDNTQLANEHFPEDSHAPQPPTLNVQPET